MKNIQLIFLALLIYTTISAQSTDQVKDEVWQRELQYWKYVEQNDKVNYLTLWHNDFVGYPDSEIVRKNKIADWINELHNRKGSHYEYSLSKKEVNVFGDVVITFYDESDIWKNDQNEVVAKETFKITHTWKKYGDKWLIIGGMSALKKE
ncbi:MAG TPA: nuclear transport factor 2 family protein [Chryseolinea sp.]|nr:nuclear transport factor 2 family protein [Chryseolinea sp.]